MPLQETAVFKDFDEFFAQVGQQTEKKNIMSDDLIDLDFREANKENAKPAEECHQKCQDTPKF